MATLGVEDVSDDDVRRAAEVVEQVEGAAASGGAGPGPPGCGGR
jgi:hypothetical protein